MAGKFPLLLLLCLLFCTGKFCHATLGTLTPSIPSPFAVGTNVTISIDVTDAENEDVRVSLGGTLFETVEIGPLSISFTDAGSSSYDSRVSVTHEVVTANTHVRVKVTFTLIQKADDGLEIKFEDSTGEAIFTLNVEYCNNTIFGNNATYSSTTCGIGCTAQFTCASDSSTFPALCRDNATWNVTDVPCPAACTNSDIAGTYVSDDSTALDGDSKEFTCACHKCITNSFSRTCGSVGHWSDGTNPCYSDINQRAAACSMQGIYGVTLIIAMAVAIAVWSSPAWLIAIYVISSCLAFSGCIMIGATCSNGVSIAGISLANIGDVGLIVSIALHMNILKTGDLSAWIIAFYVVSSCLGIPGIIMISVGLTDAVAIAGLVLANLGEVVLIVITALYVVFLKNLPGVVAKVNGTSYTPIWKSSPGATSYELEISIGSTPNLTIPNAKSGKTISNDFIKPGTTYNLSVVAISGNQRSVVGNTTFTTGDKLVGGRGDGNVARNDHM